MKYLVVEYIEAKDEFAASNKHHLIEQDELWYWLNRAKAGKAKIAVYEVGNCVIDWS